MTQNDSLKNRIYDALSAAGIDAVEDACGKLAVYMEGVLEKNKDINLTAITDPDRFIKEHIVDSASLLRVPEYEARSSEFLNMKQLRRYVMLEQVRDSRE